MTKNGKCRLCLKERVDLQESHFLPKGLYRLMRGDPAKGNPNPWHLTREGQVQTSKQHKAHLLCLPCEQRFSKNGEDWIFRNGIRRNGGFRLASVLASRPPDFSSPQTSSKVYYATGIPEINVAAIAYFAASVFWRASVYGWNDDASFKVKLGPYEEEFRRYLAGEADFPLNAALLVCVRETGPLSHITFEPAGGRLNTVHAHKFAMPGFSFTLFVSKQLDNSLRKLCLVRGVGNPLLHSAIMEPIMERGARQMMASSDSSS